MTTMNKFRKIELGLFGLYFVLTIIQLCGINVSVALLLSLLTLDIFWTFTFIQSKKIDSIGFSRKNLTEKILVSLLLWGISMNISTIAYSSLLIKLGLLILTFYYLINGIIKWGRQKKEWFNGLERIILALILFGFFLRLMAYPGGGILRIFSLMTLFILMVVYSFISVVQFNKDKQSSLAISSMIMYWSISLGVLFMLFDVMFWSGKSMIFSLYFMVTLFASILYLIKYFSTNKSILNETNVSLLHNTARRVVIYNLLCLFLIFLSRRQFERFEFGNRSQLIDAIINCKTSQDEAESALGCDEADRLDSLYRAGEYPEEL